MMADINQGTLEERKAKVDAFLKNYVMNNGHCVPDTIELLDENPPLPVWKVTVKEWNAEVWDERPANPPPFWLVLTQPMVNLYRPDFVLPVPHLPFEEQSMEKILDLIKSHHIGVCTRLNWAEKGSRRLMSEDLH